MHGDDTLRRFESSEPFTGRLEPLDDQVLIEPLDEETETATGVIIPPSADATCTTGIVVAAGEDAAGIAPGDKVLYPRGAGFEVRISGQPKRIVNRHELIARLHDEKDPPGVGAAERGPPPGGDTNRQLVSQPTFRHQIAAAGGPM